MITQTDRSKEWYQATVVFGNFDNANDAQKVIESLKGREDFVSGHTLGSWSPTRKGNSHED